ncbi:MAG: hypothetical protein M3680_26325 [Myxococcota bacterium]|nr:hypothetical protein [Myxococcota bacterium]
MRQPIDPWVFILIPLVIMGLGLLIASSRRGSVGGTKIGSRQLDVHNPADPDAVFGRLKALGGKYRIDDANPQLRMLVFSSSPTFATWGFLYPVNVVAEGTGTRIEIGIASRFIQFGPLVGSAHKQMVKAVEELLGVPVARVA